MLKENRPKILSDYFRTSFNFPPAKYSLILEDRELAYVVNAFNSI